MTKKVMLVGDFDINVLEVSIENFLIKFFLAI